MVVYGKQIVFFILKKYPSLIQQIYFSKEIPKKEFYSFSCLNKPITILDFKKAQAMAKGQNHQGYFLEIKEIEFFKLKDINKNSFILILNDIQDMGNMGAILRSAYGFGVEAVIICGIKNIKLSSIIRSSSALALCLPLVSCFNPLDAINELKQVGFSILGADMHGEDIANIKLNKNEKRALILSNEHTGLSAKLRAKLDKTICIKTKNNLESLNVSVAGGILLRELSLW